MEAIINKISVIIPTVQKKINVLTKLISLLEKDDVVEEILIINNLTSSPLKFDGNNYNKVKIFTPDTNYYVNKSWNLGVSMIKNDTFALFNDDMLPCENFCTKIINSNILEKPDTGLLGMNPVYINQFAGLDNLEMPKECNDTDLKFIEMPNYLNTMDWGIVIFAKKENWFNIPEDIKIIFGDNYILYKNLQSGKINYKISGITVNHIHSSSSASPEFMGVIVSDIRNQKKCFNNN